MVRNYKGEMYVIPKEFEEEVRQDEIHRFQEWFLKTQQYCDYPEEITEIVEEYLNNVH